MMEPIAQLRASGFRRVFALFALGALGALLLYLAVTLSTGLGYRVLLIGMGALSVWACERMARTTRGVFALHEDGIYFNDALLAHVEEMESVDKGMFALKPTNGFSIILKEKAPRVFVPGMYWRIGRRLGIGGVTEPGAAKFMADTLTAMIADRA